MFYLVYFKLKFILGNLLNKWIVGPLQNSLSLPSSAAQIQRFAIFFIATTCCAKFFHLFIWISSKWEMRLPFENLQYHWNHPRESSLKIQPFSCHSFLDKPDLTLNRLIFTSKILLILAFLNHNLGYSLIFIPKYEPQIHQALTFFLALTEA